MLATNPHITEIIRILSPKYESSILVIVPLGISCHPEKYNQRETKIEFDK